MPRKRLILHIGTHKTGTSSFQRSLNRNREALIKQGLLPVSEIKIRRGEETDKKRANATGIAHLFIRPELLTGVRIGKAAPELTEDQCKTRRARLAERLRDLPDQTVLLSAEAFSFLRTPDEQQAMRDFLTETERDVLTIAVFREETAWRESWENQLKFSPNTYQAVMRQPDEQRINADWFYDTSAIRAFWAPFNLTELSYEAHDNIVDTLYKTMGLSTADLKTDLRANTRKTGTLHDQIQT